ncbi:MAG: cytochrome P450 [Pseudonocardia sp.]|nr:MAG: cytochrome P450 [Pseudonocardia sp.]
MTDTASPMNGTAGVCPMSKFAAEFNPFTDPYLSDPYPILARGRREEPVFYSPELDYYVVTRYDDVRAVFRNIKTFSADVTVEPITPFFDSSLSKLAQVGFVPGPSLVNEDEPVHMKRRKRLSRLFSRDNVDSLEPRIRALVNTYIDKIVTRGSADIVADLVWEIPALVAFMIMGVPDEDVNKVKQFATRRTLLTWGRPTEAEQNALVDDVGEYWNYCIEHIAKTKKGPGNDFVGELVRAGEEDPDLFDDIAIRTLMMNFLFAAHETTTNATANGIKALLELRDQWNALCADPELIPNAVEECLRYSSSVIAWRRRAMIATEIGGVEIPENARILLILGSANHDDSTFVNGDEFDIRRTDAARHISFGVGTHTCLGAPVARLEMRIILEELSRRLPHLALTDNQDFSYSANTSFRGPDQVLVRWDPDLNPVEADRPGHRQQ